MNVMQAAARKAARGLRRDFGEVENLQVSRKGPGDFVSEADLNAEKILLDELSHARPGYGFLLEERGVIEGSDKTHRWIIDPLDGTSNFLHAIPHFAISIALEREGELVAGLVYNPITDETYQAEKGQGAFLNDRRVRVAGRSVLEAALFACGAPWGAREGRDIYLAELNRILPICAGIRRMGAASLDLAYLAAGRFDGYWERETNLWDIAAGIVLVREAGGLVSTPDNGQDFSENGAIVAGNETMHGALLRLLRG